MPIYIKVSFETIVPVLAPVSHFLSPFVVCLLVSMMSRRQAEVDDFVCSSWVSSWAACSSCPHSITFKHTPRVCLGCRWVCRWSAVMLNLRLNTVDTLIVTAWSVYRRQSTFWVN